MGGTRPWVQAVTRGFVAASVLGVAGCAGLGPDAAGAASVAVSFHEALVNSQGDKACDLLAPAPRQELEERSEDACAAAVLDAGVPGSTVLLRSRAYGREAQVTLDGDVVFLAVSGKGWLVTAAGCAPEPEKPYDCAVAGG